MQCGDRAPRALGVVGAVAATVLSACTGGVEYPQTTFHPVSEYGEALNRVFANTFWWTMIIMVLVLALVLYVMLRFRERPGMPQPKQIHGNTKLELIWTIAPAIIVVLIGVPTVTTIFATQRRPAEDALLIEVIGHQWWWEFRYPEQNVVTANEFWVPIGREVHLQLSSADVIHSFWVPRFGGKRDVNPLPRTAEGERQRYNHILFTVSEPGRYSGQCAEFCGEAHGIMALTGVAAAPDEFDAWVQTMQARPPAPPPAPAPAAPAAPAAGDTAGGQAPPAQTPAPAQQAQPPQPPAGPPLPGSPQQLQRAMAGQTTGDPTHAQLVAEGQRIFFTKPCIACHAISGTTAQGLIGPNLTRFGARPTVGAGALPNTEENVARWIANPQAIKAGTRMPGVRTPGGGFPPTGLTAAETRAVAAYLSSLR
jgi:cytochrome c oxidase subunit II